MIKSSKRSGEDKVINILDAGHSNGGDHSEKFTVSKFNSPAQVHIKPLYQIFHLASVVLGLVSNLSTAYYRVFGSHSAQSRKHPG